MQYVRSVSWEQDVLPAWLATHPLVPDPNSDIRAQIPRDVEWFLATISATDIEKIRLIGSADLKNTFGSYQLESACQRMTLGDSLSKKDDHVQRVDQLVDFFSLGNDCAPLIVVAAEKSGPYTLIDGNHRAIALHLCSRLVGQRVYAGIAKSVATDFMFYALSCAD